METPEIAKRAKQFYDKFSQEFKEILGELEEREKMVYFMYCVQNCMDMEHVLFFSKREVERKLAEREIERIHASNHHGD